MWLPLPVFSEYRSFFGSPKSGGIGGAVCISNNKDTVFVNNLKVLIQS